MFIVQSTAAYSFLFFLLTNNSFYIEKASNQSNLMLPTTPETASRESTQVIRLFVDLIVFTAHCGLLHKNNHYFS